VGDEGTCPHRGRRRLERRFDFGRFYYDMMRDL
jgi:hypothetical protein